MNKKLKFLSCFNQETHRFFLWLPVSFAIGIMCFFHLSLPSFFVLFFITGSLSFCVFFYRKKNALIYFIFLQFLLCTSGLIYTYLKTQWQKAPIIQSSLYNKAIIAEIHSIEVLPKAMRIIVKNITIENMDLKDTPYFLRLFMRKKDTSLTIGDIIQCKATLKPPPPPVNPFSFDFRLHAYFNQMGGIGYIHSFSVHTKKKSSFFLKDLRQSITQKIYACLPSKISGITAALITGEKTFIPENTYALFRKAGLAHLLAISGLHIGLISGFIFFFLRYFLLFALPFSYQDNAKKIAASGTILSTLFYVFIAGARVSTLRAFCMISFLFLSILLNRQVFSLRSVAVAAFIILVISPNMLLNPGFQMSFIAVLTLIGLYEHYPFFTHIPHLNFKKKIFYYFFHLMLTSFFISLATLPYIIYHFNHIQLYGIITNLFAIPLMAFWIMPMALLFLLGYCFNFTFPLLLMGKGIEFLYYLSFKITQLPGTEFLVPSISVWALILFTIGFLWFFLWKTSLRLWGAIPMICFLFCFLISKKADIYIAPDGRMIGVFFKDHFFVSHPYRSRFTTNIWMQRLACTQKKSFPYHNVQNRYIDLKKTYPVCDINGCLFPFAHFLVAFPHNQKGFDEDCQIADVIIAPFIKNKKKTPSKIIIDAHDIKKNGAYEINLSKKINLYTTYNVKGKRNWNY